jgi:hypothetical protein
VYAHGSAGVITASASSAQAMSDSDGCEKRVSQEHNQAKSLEPTVASVTVRRVGLTVHLDVVAPRYVHLLIVGSRVDEVCPVPSLSATDSTTTAQLTGGAGRVLESGRDGRVLAALADRDGP